MRAECAGACARSSAFHDPPLAPPQLLHEAVHNEDDARHGPSVEAAGPGAAALLEALRERQALVAEGAIDLERSFDDFRLVVGDGTL